MTHDFHYYVSYMAARNAGYDIKTSKAIALCADGVDGGDTKFTANSGGKYKAVHKPGKSYYPITVFHTECHVNYYHSYGASIIPIPWMAFHFLPSLEPDAKQNPYLLTKINRKCASKKECTDPSHCSPEQLDYSRRLESGLICTRDSRFARALINDTVKIAKTKGKLPLSKFALLGIRAHIIADLFAHSAFAGCRSEAINALNHSNTLNEKEVDYELGKRKGASFAKTTLKARLGHGQAGRRPDEPVVKFNIERNVDGQKFAKENPDLFGAALMTITEALKGNVQMDYKNWKTIAQNYLYNWETILPLMNNDRPGRNLALQQIIIITERVKNEERPVVDLGLHDCSDYWAFDQMDMNLQTAFSVAADMHLQWFHETFERLTGIGIDQYMDVSVRWPWVSSDDNKAREYNQTLLKGGTIALGDDAGNISGYQIGTHYMQQKGGHPTPLDVYKKLMHQL